MIKRREFITFLGGAAAWPLAASGQQAVMPVVGFLNAGLLHASSALLAGFHDGLKELGYVEGRNLAIDYRWAEGQYDRLPALAADLVDRRVAIIFAGAPPSARAAKAATATIPIVFTVGDDPVRSGLVVSLNRPGGNLTGISVFTAQLGAKQLGLLRELVPNVAPVGMLVNPANPLTESVTKDVLVAGATSGHDIRVVKASTEAGINEAFATIAELRIGAVVIGTDSFFFAQRDQIIRLATRYKIPTIFSLSDYVRVGGLMSYGASIADGYRQAGIYTARILRGEKPANLPVLQPTRFEFVINLKTAKALGLEVPPTLRAIADEVIE